MKDKNFVSMLLDFLIDNDLSMVNNTTMKVIKASSGYENDWEVIEQSQLSGKEYKTLSGAVGNSKKDAQ